MPSSQPPFLLYTTPLSANGRKVLALSRQLGLAPEVQLVNVYRGEGRTPQYLALNPSGKIPTLVEGAFRLSESNAILQYLSEAHGDYRLSSRDARQRAAIASWLFWESAHWQPALAAVLEAHVGHLLLPRALPAPAAPPDWRHARLAPLLDRVEQQLRERPFLAGDEPSLADFSVGGMTTYFRATGFPFAAFPSLAAWCERLDALAAWRESADPLWS
jgi:glutathione S-transferase